MAQIRIGYVFRAPCENCENTSMSPVDGVGSHPDAVGLYVNHGVNLRLVVP